MSSPDRQWPERRHHHGAHVRELEVRGPPASVPDPAILSAFDQLLPGSALVLASSRYPRDVLKELQLKRPGRFDWSVLQVGPPQFRVEVHRHVGPPRTALGYLAWDHHRLEGLLTGAEDLAKECEVSEALARYSELRTGLERHLRMEEEVLFPAFDMIFLEDGAGPTRLLRAEHAVLRELAFSAGQALLWDGPPGFLGKAGVLREGLQKHHAKEQVLYHATDEQLGGERAHEALVKRMQEI